jgi:hypothetical protein
MQNYLGRVKIHSKYEDKKGRIIISKESIKLGLAVP